MVLIKNENIKKARDLVWKVHVSCNDEHRSMNTLELIEICTPLEAADKEMSAMIEFLKAYGTCQTCGNGPEPKENDFLCEQCHVDVHGLGNIYWHPNDELRAIKENEPDDKKIDWETVTRDADEAVKKLEDGDRARQYQQKLLKETENKPLPSKTELQDIKNKKSKMIVERGDPVEIAILEIEIAKQEIERGEALKACSNIESAIRFLEKEVLPYKFVRSGYVIGYERAYFKEKRDGKE